MPALTGRGINQADLISFLNLIRTNFVAVTAKLDADGGVADTDYASLWNFTVPVGIGSVGIRSQGAVLDYLKTVRTAFNGVLTKLDADATVNDTNYSSLRSITTYIDESANGSLGQAGVYEGALVKWLSRYLTNFNAVLTKLDADSGVTGTNYNSLWAMAATLIDSTGCMDRPGTGSTVG